jgi:hypothetical protein
MTAGRAPLPRPPLVASHVDRNAALHLDRGEQAGLVDSPGDACPPRLGERMAREVLDAAVDVRVHLDEDPAVLLAELHRLIEDLPFRTVAHRVEENRDVLGVETDAAVRRQAADGPRRIRAVDGIEVVGEAHAISAERIVGAALSSARTRTARRDDGDQTGEGELGRRERLRAQEAVEGRQKRL